VSSEISASGVKASKDNHSWLVPMQLKYIKACLRIKSVYQEKKFFLKIKKVYQVRFSTTKYQENNNRKAKNSCSTMHLSIKIPPQSLANILSQQFCYHPTQPL